MTPMVKRTRFEGAMTALITPFRNGAIDDAALTQLVEDQIAAGIDGLVPCGTTGEASTLSHEEHVHVVSVVVKQAKGRVPVIAGAGANATAKAIDLARAVRDVGADGQLQVVPYYNRPSQDGLERHFKAIAEAVPLPMILYNIPSRSSCDMLPDTVARLAEVPSIVGIKEATSSTTRASQILARCADRLAVISGDDATAFPLYAVGARGVISVLSNVAPRLVAEMWDHVASGRWDAARALHDRSLPVAEMLFAEPSPGPTKAVLALRGAIADELRLPMLPATGPLRERLRAAFVAAGLT
jgi:4-hydroxy-tetrahydrodipicolinate synthase